MNRMILQQTGRNGGGCSRREFLGGAVGTAAAAPFVAADAGELTGIKPVPRNETIKRKEAEHRPQQVNWGLIAGVLSAYRKGILHEASIVGGPRDRLVCRFCDAGFGG